MRTGLWHALDARALQPVALGEWRELAGADYSALRTLLESTHEVAQRCPCGNKTDCGCQHKIEAHADGRYLSVCQCRVGNCRTAKLSLDEATLYELDVKRLVRALCGVLKLGPAVNGMGRNGGERLRLVGTYGGRGSPVFVALCPSETELVEIFKQVVSWGGEPFIVLSPTARVRSKAVELFLEAQRSVFIPLAPCVAVDRAGKFRMTNPIDRVLTDFETGLGNGSGLEGTAKGANGSHGRLRYKNDFADVWVGEMYFDLRKRNPARFCVRYLVEQKAFSKSSARHLEKEIDPYVRKHCDYPRAAEIKIHHYFQDHSGRLPQLRKALIRPAGRNGRFYLMIE